MEYPGWLPGWISICTGVLRSRLICSIPCSISRRLRMLPVSPGNAIASIAPRWFSILMASSLPSITVRLSVPEDKSCSVRNARLVM
ncbi:hypothetical protein SRABI106_03271 [Rahnella aquatilis]|nr:hypothetical protein SRABI106_03271 [Rahnella aquatilis]